MTGVQISQVRWPVELYQWLQDTAYKKRQSMNKTIIEIVENARNHEEAKQ
ncbi:MAG: Arc family DNA-binding protein [Synergistaceae bacterium]|nr:Arc family DNA-binding protein [Synergistaceae bacterium]